MVLAVVTFSSVALLAARGSNIVQAFCQCFTRLSNSGTVSSFMRGHSPTVLASCIWVDYRVPPRMYDELAAYDGSVVPERTPASYPLAATRKRRTSWR